MALFDIGVCSVSSTQSMVLIGLTSLAFIIMTYGLFTRTAGWSIIGGIMMLACSWFFVGCIPMIGWIFAGMGLVSIGSSMAFGKIMTSGEVSPFK